ncbi:MULTISPECIES: hypothetical protein [Vreelandella]|uniref:Tripartite tricarboxylate transporter TctB family protein n=2 Tax=Vreelandella TaxID=3137766 RepID=A0A7C9K446_9GAMM|nr:MULTISPECIES: hypothetical protein [Halomonas]NDL69922.1 hypothetical protein [Halomonas alkaliphila]NYS45900.1 hypothetical protein [Halomonas zhaodongensis]
MTPETQMQRKNLWSGLGVTLLSCWLLAWLIPRYGGSGMAFGMHPQRLATLGAWVMLLCAATLAVASFIQLKKQRASLFQLPPLTDAWHQTWPFLYVLFFILLATFLPLTWLAPFILGTLVALLGERRWYVVLLTAAIPTTALYVLTVHLMRIGVV